MRRKTVYSAIEGIDRGQLEAFQAGMRKRYSDDHILAELNACAKRLGRSPTMREFEVDPETTVHPQTVIELFNSWNRAKRMAGLVPRRFARPAAEVRGLGPGPARRSRHAHRMAGLPDVRRPPRRVVDVPVPDPQAARAAGRGRRRRRSHNLGSEHGRGGRAERAVAAGQQLEV